MLQSTSPNPAYRLFNEFAHRYDLHTPPGYYKHDHAFAIDEALRSLPAGCRLLDIGCGTGVFLEAAIAAGIDAYGLDASPGMIAVAHQRLDGNRVRVQRMQELSDESAYNVVCALSWTIHYSETEAELDDVFRRCREALVPGGLVIVQVADDKQMTGVVSIDREPGSSGELDSTLFMHRFRPLRDPHHSVFADYVYASQEHNELLFETHTLRFASPAIIMASIKRAGFIRVRETALNRVAPFLVANSS